MITAIDSAKVVGKSEIANMAMVKERKKSPLADLGASVSVLPFLIYTNLRLGELAPTKLIIELADRFVKRPKDVPEDIKTPLILRRPFLSTAHAKINVFKKKITLRVGNDKVMFKSEKPTSNIIKRVYMLCLRERIGLDLEARLMGEALILHRSLDPLYEDYIKLNDLNEPLELRRNRVDDLDPTIKEGEVVDEPMMDIVKTRCDNEIIDRLYEYPSYYDFDRKIHIDYAYNLQFSCMIGYEHVNANFFPLLSINVMSKSFYNSITKDKVKFNGKNVVGAFMNVPSFVRNFSVITNFAIMENMDAYHDEGMDDIIVGRPFCREAYVKARRFDGMISIFKGNDSVSAHDELKGISHPYQLLKGFYKVVLNLGPEYIKNEKVKEWLTRGHVEFFEGWKSFLPLQLAVEEVMLE
ncbi:hypothetical protein Tco_0561781 [Tanacetum coccineum]